MRIEVHGETSSLPVIHHPEHLAEFWSGTETPRGAALRALLGHTYSQALQGRWSHGGYRFVFIHQHRPRPAAEPPATELIEQIIWTGFRSHHDPIFTENTPELALEAVEGQLDLPPWTTVTAGMSTWLDEWLLFRRSRAWIWQDDISAAAEPVLSEPWRRCVGELVDSEQWMVATCYTMESHRLRHKLSGWGDHGTALIVATNADVHVLQVGLWTG